MKKQIALKAWGLSLLALLALAGCGGGQDRAGEGTVPVALSLRLPEAEKLRSKVLSAPSVAASMELKVTGEGMTEIDLNFGVQSGERVRKILDIPVGSGRVFAVTIFDGFGNARLSGESGAVDVRPSETPLEVAIALHPLALDVPSELPRFSANYLLLDLPGLSPFAGPARSRDYTSTEGLPALKGESSTSARDTL